MILRQLTNVITRLSFRIAVKCPAPDSAKTPRDGSGAVISKRRRLKVRTPKKGSNRVLEWGGGRDTY